MKSKARSGAHQTAYKAGLTLIETSLLISGAGILLAIMVPAFFKAVRTSKVSEAPDQLQEIFQRSASYYQAKHAGPKAPLRMCLPPAAGPTPAEPSDEPVYVDFHDPQTPGQATWTALDFKPEGGLRYSYSFIPSTSGCGLARVEVVLRAAGDLDGDGDRSLFERRARAREGSLQPDPLLRIQDRVE